jgi:crossover junction endodeoxyribonuclease RusA
MDEQRRKTAAARAGADVRAHGADSGIQGPGRVSNAGTGEVLSKLPRVHAGSTVFITLPFPHPDLSPNRAKGRHWTATARLKTEQKEVAFLATKEAIAGTKQVFGKRIPVSIVFMPKDKRHRDFDNLLAASKSLLDGIAHALGVDDSRFGPFFLDVEPGTGKTVVAIGVEMVSGVEK